MDNILKAIITAGVTNILTGNLAIALSIGWLVYFYLKHKESESDTIA
jgi:hypothetical protein